MSEDIFEAAFDVIWEMEEAKNAPSPVPEWHRSETERMLEPIVLDCVDAATDRGEELLTHNMNKWVMCHVSWSLAPAQIGFHHVRERRFGW